MRGAYSTINLQTTLAASNPGTDPAPMPHHPISCKDELLWLEQDGTFGCEHAKVPGDDRRTQFCIDHSVALLLMEVLAKKEGLS
jgi:hypothetical protein